MSQTTGSKDDQIARRARRLATIARRGQALAARLADRLREPPAFQIPDPTIVAKSWAALGQALLEAPDALIAAELGWFRAMADLAERQGRRAAGEPLGPLHATPAADRRFRAEVWEKDLVHDTIRQAYLLTDRWLQDLVGSAPGLDAKLRARIAFYARQISDALAPTNFLLTNPAALERAIQSGGDSLIDGLERLLADLEAGDGRARPGLVDREAFVVGRDLATTPGEVVFENDLMQLIQYAPSTDLVAARPLLIVPPWINRYYILDLRAENSFVRWVVAQGFTVFLISWVNPGPEHAAKDFASYLAEGPLAAMEVIAARTRDAGMTILGYCLGGTLTACLLAHLAVHGDRRIAAATFLTTMLDFAEPGDLGVFIDEEQLAAIEAHMRETGYLEACHMQDVFSLMRANDLIWSAAVQAYLLGRKPPAFDILFWNADGTGMPAMMHAFYLREMYLKNRLVRPGGISLLGTPIDLARIEVPAFFLSAREDHIAPWRSTYRGMLMLPRARFTLGGSGHIAGVINPAGSRKYGYWTNARRPGEPDAWLEGATFHEGSWWPRWAAWLRRHSGRRIGARGLDRRDPGIVEPAPGRYVRSAG